MGINVECQSEVKADDGVEILLVKDVKEWLEHLPPGAVLQSITRDFGSQRDPEVRLVGLRAAWGETKHG